MATIISILIILVCILLILVVLVQNSKGGGLASSFASSNQVMGVKKTADFLEKATWTLATALLVLSVLSTSFNETSTATTNSTKESVSRQKGSEDITPTAPEKNATPVAPAPAPSTPAPTN